MARLDPMPYPMPDLFAGDWRDAIKAQEDALTKLQDTSDNLPDGKIVGALLRWQVADGYAYYLVTKERPLTVQAVPFCDNYTVPAPLIRGLTKQDILGMLAQAKRWRSLFRSQP